jgi:protein ImuB
LGELRELPELGLVARFGDEGTRLLRMARGETQRTLRVMELPENYERSVNFDHPQRLLEPLLFVLSSLLRELMGKLEHNGLATNRVNLLLRLERRALVQQDQRTTKSCPPEHPRVLEFPVAVRDAKVILKQLQFDLEAHPPASAIVGLSVRLNPIQPRGMQHGLFIPQAPAPEKLQLTLTRLRMLMGEANVGSPEMADTYRRDAFVMRAFSPSPENLRAPSRVDPYIAPLRFAFRYYRPALAAQVRMASHALRLSHIDAGIVRGEVVAAAGPWRASGEWWSGSAWQREEWDVELSDGGLYRMSRAAAHWHIEGMYD